MNSTGPDGKKPQSVGMIILKIIGFIILGIVILIGLAFGTCLLMISMHR